MNENTKKILFSHKSDEWSTPQNFFNKLDKIYKFTLDPAATKKNHKCKKYYTIENDGLIQDWSGNICFLNPPYSQVNLWIQKAYEESLKPYTKIICLVPARTSNKWFYQYGLKADELIFIKGRLCFEFDDKPVLDKKGRKMSAPFPSIILVFVNQLFMKKKHLVVNTIENK
jgi:site-specific DNA-methyltransferase (adenine-specific)